MGTGDIEGVHLRAEQDDFTAVKFINEQVGVMISINPQYKNYVTMKGKNKVLHLMLYKAMYGTVRSAILCCTLLTETLVDLGFKLNQYDLCITNSTIRGK